MEKKDKNIVEVKNKLCGTNWELTYQFCVSFNRFIKQRKLLERQWKLEF